jgi:hypothetical protein
MHAVMVGMLMVVMVVVAAEMDVRAAPVIGDRQAVGGHVNMGYRHRSDHEMSDKQQQ